MANEQLGILPRHAGDNARRLLTAATTSVGKRVNQRLKNRRLFRRIFNALLIFRAL